MNLNITNYNYSERQFYCKKEILPLNYIPQQQLKTLENMELNSGIFLIIVLYNF